jgi:hypothetical protein
MIRCIRLWTGDDGNSLFEEGFIDLAEGMRGDAVGAPVRVLELSFQETRSGGSYQWHQDPVPRYVITLSGTLEFEVKSGATFTIRPGDILLAQDNSGTGHKWRLIGDDPRHGRNRIAADVGADLARDGAACRRTRADTAATLAAILKVG